MSDFFSYSQPEAESSTPRTILAELSSADWENFIGYAARRRYAAGAVVLEAGDTSRALCFIASGQVEVRSAGAPKKANRRSSVRVRSLECSVFRTAHPAPSAPPWLLAARPNC